MLSGRRATPVTAPSLEKQAPLRAPGVCPLPWHLPPDTLSADVHGLRLLA